MPRPDFGYHTVAETAIDKRDMTAGQVRQSFLLCCRGLYQYTRPADYPARFHTDRAIMEFLAQYGAKDVDWDDPLSPDKRCRLEWALLIDRDNMQGIVSFFYPSFLYGYVRELIFPGATDLGFFADRMHIYVLSRSFVAAEWCSHSIGGRALVEHSAGLLIASSGSSYSCEGTLSPPTFIL